MRDEDDDGASFEAVTGVHETDAALLVRFDDGVEKWVPKTCTTTPRSTPRGTRAAWC